MRYAVIDGVTGGHVQCAGQRPGGDIADQSGHDLGRRSRQRQRRVVGKGSGGHRHRIGLEAVGDRGGCRAGCDGDRIVGRITGGHGERAGQRPGGNIADQSGHHLGCRSRQGQRRVLRQQSGIDSHDIACRRWR